MCQRKDASSEKVCSCQTAILLKKIPLTLFCFRGPYFSTRRKLLSPSSPCCCSDLCVSDGFDNIPPGAAWLANAVVSLKVVAFRQNLRGRDDVVFVFLQERLWRSYYLNSGLSAGYLTMKSRALIFLGICECETLCFMALNNLLDKQIITLSQLDSLNC